MKIDYQSQRHPHIKERQNRSSTDSAKLTFNQRIALMLTSAVGTMWCAYAFAVLALIALPTALHEGPFAIIQWVSQTFIQLVMLSVIMVGQNLMTEASEKRAEITYRDAEATFVESQNIQDHLARQDTALNAIMAKLNIVDGDPGCVPIVPPISDASEIRDGKIDLEA